MRKKILQFIPIVTVLFAAAAGHAYTKKSGRPMPEKIQEEQSCKICPPCKVEKPCCTEIPTTGQPCTCAYNAPARIDTGCGMDAWLSLSYIYWRAEEKGLDLGYQYNENAESTVHSMNPVNLDFDYTSGFKLGAGSSSERDDWTLYLEYTRLKSNNSSSKDISGVYDTTTDFLLSNWMTGLDTRGTDTQFSYLKGSWEVKYNTLDLELGRPFYLGKKLVFKPHYGIRGAWIDQTYNLDARVESVDYFAKNTQDSWLVGPRAGLDTDWLIGKDFRIFGNLAGSLSYQKIKTTIRENDAENSFKGSNVTKTITPNVEFGLGIGYGTYFSNYEWYFDLAIGYDFHYFWDQNRMRHLADGQKLLSDGDAGNLMLHGLTISARLDF